VLLTTLDPLFHGFWRFGSDGNLYMFGKKTVDYTYTKIPIYETSNHAIANLGTEYDQLL
jgi:hypothetical protein